MRRSRSRRRSRPRQDRLTVLMQVARELTSGLDLVGVARRALALSTQAVGAALGSLLLLDEEGRLALAILLHEGKFRRGDIERARAALRDGLAGWVVENRQPVLLENVDADPRWMKGPFEEPARQAGAAICAPLLLPRRVIGVLTCTHPEAGHFDADDLQMLQVIADQAAVALESARLFAAEGQRRELANTLSEIARTVTATLDLEKVLDLILEQLGRVIAYDSASIFLLRGRRLVIQAWRGFEDPEAARDFSVEVNSESLAGQVVATREPLVCADVQEEKGWVSLPGGPAVRGWIGAPLIARGEVIGALTVDSHLPNSYDVADAQVVAAFASHAAIAVANARLWYQIQRRLEEVAFLHKTGQTVTASLELDDVLGSLMDSVREHFRVEAASVALVDEGTGELVFRVATGAAGEEVVGTRLQPGEGIAGWVAKTGKSVIVPATRRDPRFYSGVDRATGFQTRSMLAVPIKLGQETIGVIEALNPVEDRLDEGDLRLLANAAALAGSAIQNARHFTRARDAEQRYSSLFENSADPIVITDAAGRITDVNRKLCEMLGYGKSQMLGVEVASVHRDPDATRERLARALEGQSIFYNVEAIARDGTVVPFEVRATRVSHDARPYVQWVCHDLTERLALEQVRQDLTHMIIHDLRNPLSSLVSSVELIHTAMRDKTITIPVEELFAVAQRSGERLYLLIDSILDLARLEDREAELAWQSVDVESMVEDVVEQMLPTVTARELRLESDVPAELPPLWGDRNLLQRTLLNLLGNAAKFTPAGGEVRLVVSGPDQERLMFSVSDTGPGIPVEYHERIFDRFTRVEWQDMRGTGLGLALCKLVVEAHGGRIWVESEPGEGATFRFVVPVGGKEDAA